MSGSDSFSSIVFLGCFVVPTLVGLVWFGNCHLQPVRAGNVKASEGGKIKQGREVILHFPNKTLGNLSVFPAGPVMGETHPAGVGPACGTVKIPANSKVRVALNCDGMENFSPFAQLGSMFVSLDARDLDELTDATIGQFAKIPSLKELKLDKTDVTDKGLRSITALNNLTILTVSRTCLTNQGLAEIAKMKGLTRLEIDHNVLTDASIANLAPLQNLRLLNLSGMGISNVALSHLLPLKNLDHLIVADNHLITDDGLAYLVKLPRLKLLDLTGTGITGGSKKWLAQCKQLTVLHVGSAQINPADLQALRSAMPRCNVCLHSVRKSLDGLFAPLH